MDEYFEIYVHNGLFLLNTKNVVSLAYYKNYQLKIIKDCIDEDLKTFFAKKQEMVPSGTLFKNFEVFRNLYGTFFNVRHNNYTYSIDPRYVDLLKIEERL